MKRVLAILLATAAVALGLGNVSWQAQNAPQQPVPPKLHPLSQHSLSQRPLNRFKAHLPIRARKQDPPLADRTF